RGIIAVGRYIIVAGHDTRRDPFDKSCRRTVGYDRLVSVKYDGRAGTERDLFWFSSEANAEFEKTFGRVLIRNDSLLQAGKVDIPEFEIQAVATSKAIHAALPAVSRVAPGADRAPTPDADRTAIELRRDTHCDAYMTGGARSRVLEINAVGQFLPVGHEP